MAETRLTVKELGVSTSVELSTLMAVPSADGSKFLLKGANIVFIENNSATLALTVTFKMVGLSNTGNADDVDVVVPFGDVFTFNPSEHWRYADAVANDCHMTYDATAAAAISDIKIGVIRIPMSAI